MSAVDPTTTTLTTRDGLTLRVEDSGPGPEGSPTLLLVHGWSQDLRTWDRVVEDLRTAGETVRIVRHDHRGHGGSDAAPSGTATVGRAADDLAAVIADRAPTGPLVLVGHSMGGMTIMALAERHPDLVAQRVRGVAFVATASDDMADLTLGVAGRRGQLIAKGERLLAPWAAAMGRRAPVDRTGDGATAPSRDGSSRDGSSRDGARRAARIRRRAAALAPFVRALVFGHHPDPADVASVAEQSIAADPASVVAFRASIGEHRRRRALAALRGTPSVVLVGDRDRLCPPHHARAIAAALPDAEFVLYPGAGHMINYERHAEVSAHVRGLLAAAASTTDAAAGSADTPARPYHPGSTSMSPSEAPPEEFHEVVVVGTGFAGLAQAIALREAGVDDVVLLEKSAERDGVGGTWRDNTYPGCACDIPSHMYSLSTDPNPDWSRSYSPQPEIREYLERVADRRDLRGLVRFSTELQGAAWDEESRTWTVDTRGPDGPGTYRCRFLVSGMGALHRPSVPTLPGIERFAGASFHSAQWRHDVDLRGKRVAVVGTGASAVQFVPQIAGVAASVTVYQRTPPWVLPKADHPMRASVQGLFRRHPAVHRAYRAALYAGLDARAVAFMSRPELVRPLEIVARRHIERSITDPALVDRLTPRYSIGCKRVLVSNDYYPALAREDVEVVTSGIGAVTQHGIVDADGVERAADVIIYGTGFHVTDAFDHLTLTGRDGRTLREHWAEQGAVTHLGMTVPDFPNLFLLLGPNTGLGHHSVVFMIECQARYVAQAVAAVHEAGCSGLDVRPATAARFQADVQRRLDGGIWTRGGCTSWYLDAAGVNRTIWPGFTARYWWVTRRFRPEEYELFGRASDRAWSGAAAWSGTAGVPGDDRIAPGPADRAGSAPVTDQALLDHRRDEHAVGAVQPAAGQAAPAARVR